VKTARSSAWSPTDTEKKKKKKKKKKKEKKKRNACRFQREHIHSNLKTLAQTWANANQELYSKNVEECNLSVSAHPAQSSPFLHLSRCAPFKQPPLCFGPLPKAQRNTE
jgi:hypothetical protein